MPYIHLKISGKPDDTLAASAAAKAAELTARMLNKDPALTAVVVDFIEPARWFVAGAPLIEQGKRSYHWSVSITDETDTKTQKAAYLKAAHEAMCGLLGEVAEHSYIHVADLRASAYGYAGLTQEHRYQRPAEVRPVIP